MNKNNRGVWIGVIAIVVVAALGWWWIAANQGITIPPGSTAATSTAATSTSGGSAPAVTNRNGDTVKAIVASLPSASQYESLFTSTDVASSIGSGGQFTIFVPTNTAFANLPKGTLSKMTAAQLKRLVQYSIVNGRAIQPGAQMAGAVQSYSGDPLNFTDLNNIPMVNSSIIIAEYKGSNGVVYLINAVLLPPQKSNL
ncbi:MAG TPA: fasciclin domain-containing protein [Candidatus Paceibacterota bacterium]|jgi:uncharacterized surface protein with fasciclin (FAS1) repeats|nr:fasciclin domain-containing protein [Candidatus Paceibacterota bacterium]